MRHTGDVRPIRKAQFAAAAILAIGSSLVLPTMPFLFMLVLAVLLAVYAEAGRRADRLRRT